MEADMAIKNLSMFRGSFRAHCNNFEMWGNTENEATQRYNPMVTSRPISCINSNMFFREPDLADIRMAGSPKSYGLISNSDTTESFSDMQHMLFMGAVGFFVIVIFGLFMVLWRRRRPYEAVKRPPEDTILQDL